MPSYKPTVSKIAVIFMVQNLERSARFYTETVGLQIERTDEYLIATLANGTELLFFEGEAVRGTSPQIVFGLETGGIDSAAEALAARGVQLLTPVTEAPGGWSLEFKIPTTTRSRSSRTAPCPVGCSAQGSRIRWAR